MSHSKTASQLGVAMSYRVDNCASPKRNHTWPEFSGKPLGPFDCSISRSNSDAVIATSTVGRRVGDNLFKRRSSPKKVCQQDCETLRSAAANYRCFRRLIWPIIAARVILLGKAFGKPRRRSRNSKKCVEENHAEQGEEITLAEVTKTYHRHWHSLGGF